MQAHPNPPVLLMNEGNDKGATSVPTKVAPNVWVVGLEGNRNKAVCEQIRIEFDKADILNIRTVSNVTLIQHNTKSLPLELKDKTYVSDQTFLRKLADTALENDPVVGSSGFMPFTRTDDEMSYRKCMGGECPIGNLFTSAFRWAADADIAFSSSGGIRGPGWPEGPVRVGNIWEALPFANFLCTGVMSGVSVFRLLNYTTVSIFRVCHYIVLFLVFCNIVLILTITNLCKRYTNLRRRYQHLSPHIQQWAIGCSRYQG